MLFPCRSAVLILRRVGANVDVVSLQVSGANSAGWVLMFMLLLFRFQRGFAWKCDLSKMKMSIFLRFQIGFGRNCDFSKMKMLKFLRFWIGFS